MMRAFYFGQWGPAGHHLFASPGVRSVLRSEETRIPAPFRIPDGTLAPCLGRDEAPQGVAALYHVGGWTALSFWDRSGDSRPNSNSTFIVEGVHDFDATVAAAREAFPEVWARFPFEVRPVCAEGGA